MAGEGYTAQKFDISEEGAQTCCWQVVCMVVGGSEEASWPRAASSSTVEVANKKLTRLCFSSVNAHFASDSNHRDRSRTRLAPSRPPFFVHVSCIAHWNAVLHDEVSNGSESLC